MGKKREYYWFFRLREKILRACFKFKKDLPARILRLRIPVAAYR